MKKFITLLLLTLTAFTITTNAQNTSCSAAFNYTVSNNLTVHFTPAQLDSQTFHHTWYFGDGSTSISHTGSPTHLYPSGGTYIVHHVVKHDQVGTIPPCNDSTTTVIHLTVPCDLTASFATQTGSGTQWNHVSFISTATGTVNYYQWNFGDGSSSSTVNPTHIYSNPGTYTACLIVIRDSTCRDTTCHAVVVVPTSPLPCTLTASFTSFASTSQWNGVYFSNTSTPAGDIHSTLWSFGDGTYTTTTNAFHTYANAGTYTVCLKVSRDSLCKDSTCHTVVVVAPLNCNLHAKFSYAHDSVQTNKIYFTNLSTPVNDITSTTWSFGDGTASSIFSPTHVYANSGVYHVCLTIRKDSSCHRDTCMDILVQVPPPPPNYCNLVANFTSYPDSVQINKIHFSNLSIPLAPTDSITWNFGDGTTSHEVNPIHVYSTPGTYTVCLRVKKNANTGTSLCIREICKQVIVQATCAITANFSSHADSLNSLKEYFTDLSTPLSAITSVNWTFGDGTSSNSFNPDHTYSHSGTYTVCLHISSGAGCYSSICKTIVVVEPISCLDISKFTFTHSTANCLEFSFIPDHLNSTWQYHWTFGDGTASNSVTASHVYAQPGNYTVCLSVTRSLTCASTTCKPITTGLCFSCNNVWVRYSYVRDPNMPNKFYFHGQSNYPITSEQWTFTKISPDSTQPVVINQFDPVYTFTSPGYYRVCLRAVTYGGCVKEYCEVIYIGTINTACTLTSYPNPAHSTISVNVVETAPEVIHVYIYNSLNILMLQRDQQGFVGSNIVTMNIENLIAGTYTMRVVYGNHVCYSQFQKF